MAGRRQRLRDALRFFSEWVRNPRSVAAVAPSGAALASLITREIGPDVEFVLELGPGTGVFTEALLERGVRQEQLVLVESSPPFASLLAQRYPWATVLNIDACNLAGNVAFAKHQYGAAVCGLGLLNMAPEAVKAIVSGAFDRMAPGAAMYLFTYGRRCSIPSAVLDDLGLEAARVGTTFLNIPPASVYRIARQRAGGRNGRR